MVCTSSGLGCNSGPQGCPDQYGCIPGQCPDFTIRRNDTKPSFRVKMEDCDGPLDLTGLVLEASMWAKGKLKKALALTDTYFSLADNIGFNQMMVGDTIIMDRPRSPEHMLVVGFDEDDGLVLVQRAYHGTVAQNWKRGTPLRILKFSNSQAQTEMLFQDVLEMDGTTNPDVLIDSFFVYEWGPTDTCLPGCYYLEFKLIKMIDFVPISNIIRPDDDDAISCVSWPVGTVYGPLGPYVRDGDSYENGLNEIPGDELPSPPADDQFATIDDDDDGGITEVWTPSVIALPPSFVTLPSVIASGPYIVEANGMSIIPSFTPSSDTPSTFGCGLGDGVEWIRRFPVDSEGFLIQIVDSPSSEYT